jgi:hypothetical protein
VISSTRIAPPNSMVAVSDPAGGEPTSILPASRIAATQSCIVIGCLPFMDGETMFVLGPASKVDPGGPSAFDGTIATPSRKVAVTTVEGEAILVTAVPDTKTRVRVWTNRTREPDRVMIGVG